MVLYSDWTGTTTINIVDAFKKLRKCHFCGTLEPYDIDIAAMSFWIPYFYHGNKELGPCCPQCIHNLRINELDHQWELTL